MKLPEYRIRCGLDGGAGKHPEDLLLRIDDKEHVIRLRISQLSRKLVANLPDVVTDLIEIATYVYAADAAIRRGGLTDAGMGAMWRRRFMFEIPVRRPELWSSPQLKAELSRTLGFLSDDVYQFEFLTNRAPQEFERFFKFGAEIGSEPDTVVMFSGGLDSFAGTLEEIVERRNRVALVSHHSSTKIGKVQADLVKAMAARVGRERLLHIPVKAQLREGSNREDTHRSRSFLFAALGMATAEAFKQSRIVFFENGVVSLNLPPVGQVVGARATRTTHPQVLAGFSRLFSLVLGGDRRVHNPYFWRTKSEVIERIDNLGFADQIRHTRSCADVHNLTKMHTHCGRCSQCIDRRFAMIAADLQDHDPGEAYKVDLMHGPREKAQDREIALAYVRNARFFRYASEPEVLAQFGEVSRAVNFLEDDASVALKRIVKLHRRHGSAVSGVMEGALSSSGASPIDPNSLLALYRADQSVGSQPPELSVLPAAPSSDEAPRTWTIRLDRKRRVVRIDGVGEIKNAGFEVLNTLGEKQLEAKGQGLEPEDFPFSKAATLQKYWRLENEESVRKRISFLRRKLGQMCVKIGCPPPGESEVIENLRWHGYRLNLDHVTVLVMAEAKPVKRAR